MVKTHYLKQGEPVNNGRADGKQLTQCGKYRLRVSLIWIAVSCDDCRRAFFGKGYDPKAGFITEDEK